jgi:hypothetical protein
MTSNKQQTAVEWYIEKLLDLDYEYAKGLITLAVWSERKKSLIEQAKEMEKEQKKECWDVAHQAGRFEGKGIAEKNWQTFEQYYNETYGKNHIGDVNEMVGGEQ